jgi:hypothetical protein
MVIAHGGSLGDAVRDLIDARRALTMRLPRISYGRKDDLVRLGSLLGIDA